MPTNALGATELEEPIVLGPIESFFWRYDEEMVGEGRILVLLRLEGCIEADFLAPALDQVQRRHPKLRAVVAEGADGRLHYQFDHAASPIPFEIIDNYETETPWRETARRILQSNFPAGGPFAAITVLRNRPACRCEVYLTAPHAIADGMSGIMLLDDLLTEYAKAESKLDTPANRVLPAVSPARAKAAYGWRGGLRLFRRFLGLMQEQNSSPLTCLPEAHNILPYTHWVHWVFSPEETLRLVRRCRKEQASLSGAMVAAVCCGLRECMATPELLFRWQLPFNVREFLEGPTGPLTQQDLGCFMSSMNGFVRMKDQQPLWDLARKTHEQVRGFIEKGGPAFSYNVSSFFYDLRLNFYRLIKRPVSKMTPPNQRVTLLATNYGVLSMRDVYGSLRPRECTLMFKNEIAGTSLVMEALVLGQRLNLGFAAAGVDPAFWEQLQPAVRRHLHAAIGSDTALAKASVAG